MLVSGNGQANLRTGRLGQTMPKNLWEMSMKMGRPTQAPAGLGNKCPTTRGNERKDAQEPAGMGENVPPNPACFAGRMAVGASPVQKKALGWGIRPVA